jgi:hypothetical protein
MDILKVYPFIKKIYIPIKIHPPPKKDMAAQKPVFVAITSNSCGHCHVYRANQKGKIAEHLRDVGIVEMIEIHTDTSDPNSIGSQYHPDLSKLIHWFPIFFVFTGDSWNDHSKPLVGDVLGGYIKDGVSHNVGENRPRHDFDGIIGWINDTIRNNKYNTGQIPSRSSLNKRFPKGAKMMGPKPTRNNNRGVRRTNMPRSGRVPPRNPNIAPTPGRKPNIIRGSPAVLPKSSRRLPSSALVQPKHPIPGQQSLTGNVGNGPMTAPMIINRGPTSTLRLPPPKNDNMSGNAGFPPGNNMGAINGNPRSVQGQIPTPLVISNDAVAVFPTDAGNSSTFYRSHDTRYMFSPSIIPTGPH